MEKTKMTKVQAFSAILAILDSVDVDNKAELMTVVQSEIASLEKKKAGSAKKQAEKAEVDNIVKDTILQALTAVDKAVTVTELMTEGNFVGSLSSQKMTSLLYKLIDENKVTKSVIKGKSYFSIA